MTAIAHATGQGFSGPTNSVTSQTTASQTPVANRLMIAVTESTIVSGTPAVPTMGGTLAVTWTQIATLQYNGAGSANDSRLCVFAAFTGASPGTGTIKADWGATTQSIAMLGVDTYTDTDLTAIANAVKNVVTGVATSGTSFALTLAALQDANSFACAFSVHHQGNEATSPGTGLTDTRELHAAGVNASGSLLGTTTPGSASTALAGSWVTNSGHAAIGFELAGPSSAPVNTVAPAVTGLAAVGKTLTTTVGTWTGDISSGATYQWKHADDLAFTTNVANATNASTSSTYVVASGEKLKYLRCVVTETGTGGATPANSNVVGPIGTSTGSLAGRMEFQGLDIVEASSTATFDAAGLLLLLSD